MGGTRGTHENDAQNDANSHNGGKNRIAPIRRPVNQLAHLWSVIKSAYCHHKPMREDRTVSGWETIKGLTIRRLRYTWYHISFELFRIHVDVGIPRVIGGWEFLWIRVLFHGYLGRISILGVY